MKEFQQINPIKFGNSFFVLEGFQIEKAAIACWLKHLLEEIIFLEYEVFGRDLATSTNEGRHYIPGKLGNGIEMQSP